MESNEFLFSPESKIAKKEKKKNNTGKHLKRCHAELTYLYSI